MLEFRYLDLAPRNYLSFLWGLSPEADRLRPREDAISEPKQKQPEKEEPNKHYMLSRES